MRNPLALPIWKRLGANRSGLALIEFALSLPLLILLGFGGLELANYILTYQRLSEIAMTVADNAGRVRETIDETDIDGVMVGAKLIGGTNFAANSRIILSDLEQRTTLGPEGAGTVTTDNPNGYRQWIRWQRCAGALSQSSSYGVPLDSSGKAVTNLDSTAQDDGAVETKSTILGMGPSGAQIAATTNTAVMFVEIFYQYQPIGPVGALSSLGFISSPTMHITEAFNIRQRVNFSVTNANGLSGTQRSDCRLNNASVPTS
jgi:hypothetical protein